MVQWWGALNTSIKTLKGKRLPLTDIELHEQFKKTFGCTKAIKCKVITDNQLIIWVPQCAHSVFKHWNVLLTQTVAFGLKAAAERGMCAAFHSLSRRNPTSHLHVLDEQGLSLLHHAAANNQSHIILQLAAAGVNINQIRSERFTNSGQHNTNAFKAYRHFYRFLRYIFFIVREISCWRSVPRRSR